MQRPPRTTRRLALRLAMCLLLGAATTYAVAWALVLTLPWNADAEDPELVSEPSGWGVAVPGGWPAPARHSVRSWRGLRLDILTSSNTDDPAGTAFLECDATTGWPWPALTATSLTEGVLTWSSFNLQLKPVDTRSIWIEGVSPASFIGPRGASLDRLPIRPRWLAFTADSAVFAARFAAAWFGLPSLRGAWRRRRGLCPACGYDVRGLAACPECGAGAGRVTP